MEAGAGQSIREMAEGEQPEPEELFPAGVLEGDGLSLQSLFKKGQGNVKVTVSVLSREFPAPSGGLLNPERQGLALLTYRWQKPEPIPQWGDAPPGEERPIIGWKVRQVVEPIFIEKLTGEAGVIEANFVALLEADPVASGALLDRLKERVEKAVA
jgi:hypothetical protein